MQSAARNRPFAIAKNYPVRMNLVETVAVLGGREPNRVGALSERVVSS